MKTETPPTANVESAPAVLTGVSPTGDSAMGNGTGTDPFVSIPQVGAYRTADHRYYLNGKGPLPSVTTILSVLDKPAIVQWAKREVSRSALYRLEQVRNLLRAEPEKVADELFGIHTDTVDIPPSPQQILSVGPAGTDLRRDALALWLSKMPDFQKDVAGRLGSSVHLLADLVARQPEGAMGADAARSGAFQVSPEEKPYLDAFLGFLTWLQAQGAEIVSSEKMVWSQQGYAGTYDLIVRMPRWPQSMEEIPDGRLTDFWLIDIKTSKGYYPEYALQLIAYGYADSIILEGSPTLYPMPKIQKYGVLHLRPELYPDTGWRLIEYPVREGDYVAFLGALEIWKWKEEKRYTKSALKKASNP